MSNKDPLSVASLKRWLRIDEDDTYDDEDIEQLIEAAILHAKKYTGVDYANGGKSVEYIYDWPQSVRLKDENLEWTLEVHKDGSWVHQDADLIGDTLCIPADCHCSCDCDGCDGAPQLRLTTAPECGAIMSDIVTFVKQYVTFHYQNRGDCIDTSKLDAINKILRPYMCLAFA